MTTMQVESLTVRQMVVSALKSDSALTAMVPAARIYPDTVPAKVVWPYVHVGALIDAPFRADCADGSEVSGAVHVFVKAQPGSINDPQMFAINVNRHVARVLEAMADCHVTQAQEMRDGAEASARHGFVSFTALAA